jgi:hypothetical protein
MTITEAATLIAAVGACLTAFSGVVAQVSIAIVRVIQAVKGKDGVPPPKDDPENQ